MLNKSVPPSITRTVQLSRSEVEALCAKAARGAGMSWGLTEEVAYACGWLADRGLEGAALLALLLQQVHTEDWQVMSPVLTAGEWQTRSLENSLCPISLGATLSDFATVEDSLFDGSGLRITQVFQPCLLLPFLAMIAEDSGHKMILRVSNRQVCVEPDSSVHGDIHYLLSVSKDALLISSGGASVQHDSSEKGTQDSANAVELDRQLPIDGQTLAALEELALKTTVPPSAVSRANAGAAGSDND